ncbi:MAG TPA: NAD-dependent epimerase/dehydratase family protein [Methylomirabilota bacterium]|jgi:UDP-sulfoquinovose synthase
MRVFIAGVDGYLGWPLALALAERGHEVAGIDAYFRRDWVAEIGSQSATPIRRMTERLHAFHDRFGESLDFRRGDLRDYHLVLNMLRSFEPEALVHLGEQPSAPYSMMDVQHAVFTQINNIQTTLNILFAMREACPQAHLVKLGTMGEYGTPNLDIPEGFFTIEYRGRTDTLPFPRQAGSWYHQSKVHDSNNVAMACRIWGLRSTDIMQGVVYGTRIDAMGDDERLVTRFDFDQCFGTAINRFCAQAAIGQPLTPYGTGGQRRGFLPLRDSIQCLQLAIEHPPAVGEYRVFNQFEETYGVFDLAERVKKVGDQLGLGVEIRPTQNPRIEKEEHYYRPDHTHLLRLGYRPTRDMEGEIKVVLGDLIRYRDRIAARKRALVPDIHWDGHRRKVKYL